MAETRKRAPAKGFAHKKELTLILLVVASFALSFFPIEWRYLWDEAVYLSNAENLFSAAPYYTEIDFRPPWLSLLLYAGSRVMSIDLFARLLAAAFFTAGVVLLYLLGQKLYGYLGGLFAALLMLSSPFGVFWAHKVMADIPATVLILASIYLLFLHVEDERRPAWSAMLAGALLVAAFMTHWASALAGISALYFLAIRRLKLLPALGYGAAFLLGTAPYLAWAKLTQGSYLQPLWTAIFVLREASEPILDKLYYLKAIYRIAGPIALFGLLCYVYALVRGRRDQSAREARSFISADLPILLWALVFLGYLSVVANKEIRYILPAIPALYLLAGRGFAVARYNRLAGLAVVVVPLAGFYMGTHLHYFQGRESWVDTMLGYSGDTRDAGLYLRENLPPDGVLYANHLWPVAAYHSKRKTVVLWPRDDRFYRSYPKNMAESGYFLYYRGVEKQPNGEWLDRRPEFHKLKEFGNTALYSYKFSGQRAIDPELRKYIDEAREQFQRGAYDSVLETLAPIRIPDVNVQDLRGWSYYRMGKINEAAQAFREGLQSEPNNPRGLTGLGYCELRTGQLQTAQQHFKAAVDQVPDKVDAMTGLGMAYLRLGNKAAAAEQLRNALRLDPKNEEIRGYLSQAQAP